MTLNDKMVWIKANGLAWQVAELRYGDTSKESLVGAVDWVYDAHTMSKEDFAKKYFA